ncbi:MAG TPA: ClbS/DfsB family four-helix bundle protein [Anaerolineales bacterium]|nr:ClbS/DfsB family four-helix bundle protein [Anaerolineales bacterium]
MPDPLISTLPELKLAIDSAWSELETFLVQLTERQASMQDDHGWTIKDHVTHLAVWEDSVAILFRGRPRHEALGIDETYYAQASFDQINERIRQQRSHLTIGQAIEQLQQVHQTLMASVRGLSEAELSKTVRDFFPVAPRTDDRRVVLFIAENTANHFTEHLEWMRALPERAA